MLNKLLKWGGAIVAAIAVLSILNPFLVYHVSRYESVEFGKYYEYSGVINIHTTYSDGSATYEEIGRSCDSLGIHFAIVTDLNTVKPMLDNLDRRWGMTLIIPAVEISGHNGEDRYLIIGDSLPLLPKDGISVDSVLTDASRKGSIVILSRASDSSMHGFVSANTKRNFRGIEIYNFDRSWKDMLSIFQINKIFGAFLSFSADPRSLNYILRYPAKRINEFDSLNETGRIVGIGGLGARSKINMGGNKYWLFPSYESMFNLVHTIIVTRTPYNALYRHDRELTLAAIRKGNLFVAFSGLEPARGFLFTARSGSTEAVMGDSLRLQGKVAIQILLPDSDDVETQILRDGRILGSYENAGRVDITVDMPGTYRVQVFQKRSMLPLFIKRLYPWILSNPIYVYK